MAQREVTVASAVGLHARPAAAFVKAVQQLAATDGLAVTVGRIGASPVDASSIVSVMALGAKQGETLIVCAEGNEVAAADALDRLTALIAQGDMG